MGRRRSNTEILALPGLLRSTMQSILVVVSCLMTLAAALPASSLSRLSFSDPKLHYHGRFEMTNESALFAWSMTSFAASFQNATTISADFNKVPAFTFHDLPAIGAKLRVELTAGAEYAAGLITVVKYVTVTETGLLTLATDLDPKLTWGVRIWKVSENFNHDKWNQTGGPSWEPPYEHKPFLLANDTGIMGFAGLAAPEGVKWLESSTPDFYSNGVRKLDFIGDSDTAGFCVDGPFNITDYSHFDVVNATNSYENWASRISRSFGAEMTIEAVSGWGVTNSSQGPVQTVKDYTNGFKHQAKWDFSKWVPDAVVIFIGPNDWFIPPDYCKTTPDFTDAYTGLLQNVTNSYKSAAKMPKLINICGGSGNGEATDMDGKRCCNHIQEACEKYNSTNPCWFVDVPQALHQKINKPPYSGCFGHYNQHGQRLLANYLLPQIGGILNWSMWQ